MYSKTTKVLILFLFLRQTFGQKFCDQKKFDSIHTKEIYREGNYTYSYIDIIVGELLFRWDLRTNEISNPVQKIHNLVTSFVIPILPDCVITGNDCEELRKLSNTSISFFRNVNRFSYEIKKFVAKHKEIDCFPSNCDLPWNMSAKGDPLSEHRLWPLEWIKTETNSKPVAAYDPTSQQLVFIVKSSSLSSISKTKIMKNSLSSNKWSETWKTDEVSNSYVGLVTLMALNHITGKTIRNNMKRAFGFVLREGRTHIIHEFNINAFVESSYNLRSLFGCPPSEDDSKIIWYVGIGFVAFVLLVVLIIVCLIAYYCSKKRETTKIFMSSSGGIGSSSSGGSSKSKSKRKSSHESLIT